ncbi:DUF6259 domain-containing protein [Gloeocapsa sp. PCC 73106]|uniref:DUF6259 domain-containing protein n=1 Tax=Gloeocapsa sp. PCC 73106 TaxID=102232 RepID=UPI000316F502|nr:DUF6259 domain-containing protein [Gloeocapsa sp. PCC 73106]
MAVSKYLKYLLILVSVPILLLFSSNFSSYQSQNISGAIDQEIQKIAQIWSTASNQQKAQLGLADLLLYSAKERLSNQPGLAQQLYQNAISISTSSTNLGNPAYYNFKALNQDQQEVQFYAIGTGNIAYLLIGENVSNSVPQTLSLDSIHYPSQHHYFIKPAFTPRPLWKASFTRADRAEFKETLVNSIQAKLTVAPELIPGPNYRALHLKWSDVTVPETTELVNVEAELRLYPDSEKSDWYINVDPKTNQTEAKKVLYQVEFPIIPNLSKQTGNNNPDYLVFPFHSGELLINPSQALTKPRKELYPGQTRWQALVYYQSNHGLNFMVTDPDGHAKTALAQSGGDGTIQLSWIHHPARAGYPKSRLRMMGNNPTVNYSCRLVTYTGDWYEGAQVYRNWMLEQDFLGTGKPKRLAINPEAAEWAKNMILSYRTFSSFGLENIPDLLGDDSNQVRQVYDFHQKNLAAYSGQISIYAWRDLPKGKPTFFDRPEVAPGDDNYIGPNFGKAIAKLRENNLRGNPYIEAPLWDVNGTTYGPEKGSKIAMRYYDQRPIKVKFGKGKQETTLTWVDVGTEPWIKKQEGIVKSLLNDAQSEVEKIDGVYFDFALITNQLNHHNPQTVGGNHASMGWKNLFQRVTSTARTDNPRYTLFTEGMADCYLNLNHFYLHFQKEIPFDIALWGDYNKTYGTKSSWATLDADPINDWEQAVPMARTLAWGQPIGRIDSAMIQGGETVQNFLVQLAHYRQANLDYLSTGRMLKPVTINSLQWLTPPNPQVPPNQLPDVMIPNAVFAHPNPADKSVLFILINGTTQNSAATVNFTIDPKQYNLANNYQLYRRSVSGNPAIASDTPVGNFSQGSLTQSLQLQPLEIVTYVAKP